MVSWSEKSVSIAGVKIHVQRGGSGTPLLVLHHDIGSLDKVPFYDELAKNFDVIVPHHPGFGKSERPQWMRSVRDVAVMHQELLAELGVTGHSVVGLGFGGWIAAEMATMAPRDIKKMVLVGAMGVKPAEGEYITDQALVSYIAYVKEGFSDAAAFEKIFTADPDLDIMEQWDVCREMCFRIAWKPYMYSQTLPHLLKNVKTQTLILWGDKDKIVPRSAGEAYAKALPNAKLETISGGHLVDLENPTKLASAVTSFVKA